MEEEIMFQRKSDNKEDEKHWGAVLDNIFQESLLQLGTYYTHMIRSDIKHLAFTLSRYKYTSKLLVYRDQIDLLELGCQEALGALMFRQNNKLGRYVGVDLDQKAIEWNCRNMPSDMEFICDNFFNYEDHTRAGFDAIVSLDVIEHIGMEKENEFCEVIRQNIKQDGVAIIGTPSIMLSPYASEGSKIGHINLYDQKRLYRLMNKYFHNVYIFNMNDEVVNTGFAPMACYIFAVCCNKK